MELSTISGNWKRGTGLLNNELHVGRLVWNRQRFMRDPETGKRQARPNPPEEWIIEQVPEFRIVDQSLWDRVKRRQGAIREDILTARETNVFAPGAEAAGASAISSPASSPAESAAAACNRRHLPKLECCV